MQWLVIDEKYLNYLRNIENKIPQSNYGKNKYKPFFGILFETNDCYYVTQISHPRQRHIHMRDNMDFKKIYEPKTNRLIAVINLNYMFPIPKYLYKRLSYKDIDKHRSFKNEAEKGKYIALMKTELKAINTMNLDKTAIKIYKNKYANPNSNLAKRCIDFKTLERLAPMYNNGSSISSNTNSINN